MSGAQLQQVYDDAGRPGAQAFRFAVKRAGMVITDKEAKAFLGKQAVVAKFFVDGRACPVMGRFRAAGRICDSSSI